MISKRLFIASVALSATLSTSAFAARIDTTEAPHHAVHRHHVAKNATANTNTASDVDRDAGMYIVKPQTEPEYFGHASGSDGAMPQ